MSRHGMRWMVAAAAGVALYGGQAAESNQEQEQPKAKPAVQETHVTVTIKTNRGDIDVELDEGKAPETVKNFLAYVDAGHYRGTIFHRVINGFMIQGGGFAPDMKQKPTRPPVKNEANNGLRNDRGTIAMARTSDPHSASAQFFVNVADNAFLNHRAPTADGWGYCVFGKVTKGLDVVDKIKAVPTKTAGMYENVPVEPVVITEIVRAPAGK